MISVIHPAARPERLIPVSDLWFTRAEQRPQYIVSYHKEQANFFAAIRHYLIERSINPGPNHPTLNGRSSYVDNVNLAASKATGDILVLATDDLEPPQGWDKLVTEAIGDTSKEAVLRCSNGNARSDARRLILHPIMTRARYEKQGWFVCPEYTGVYSDNDLTERAYADGVVIEAPHIVFQHHHPIFDSTVERDWVYEAQNSELEYRLGKETYERRAKQGFPLGAQVAV